MSNRYVAYIASDNGSCMAHPRRKLLFSMMLLSFLLGCIIFVSSQDRSAANAAVALILAPIAVLVFTLLLIGRQPMPPMLAPNFPKNRPFRTHILVSIAFGSKREEVHAAKTEPWLCALLVGTECFNVRMRKLPDATTHGIAFYAVQFLAPRAALHRFSIESSFYVVHRFQAVARGVVADPALPSAPRVES